ncbi:hypothetical protein [Agriterribacter sp.]|uniref:hypothetical protein n=1 Tax=Agriterribacter sp. TaxID=2821509 RepID=UPI002BDA3A6B|nr:hypothetical protein [Agriterribacter sp.]HRO46385.1 hypothetical protein [Agriterribacter sp.]HRQ17573.1 hypothetical protein [Agriterribacter sp.]
MKTILKVTNILSWINLIIGGILVAGGLLSMLSTPNASILLVSVVLTGSIVLHSYAALQLRKSIVHPNVPLNKQTPTGIRFIGFMALFFAMLNIGNAVVIIQNAEEVIKQVELPFKPEGIDLVAAIRGVGIFSLLFSIGIAVNVLLNIRLLRWYMAKAQE